MSTHTIKGLRQEFKAVGKFHTPPELAKYLHDCIPGTPNRVYDPTCGAGALLATFPDDAAKYGQDIDAAALADAEALPNFHGHLGDVLAEPAWLDERFPAIVANPPFSIRWEPTYDERFFGAPTVPTAARADFAFLLHILYMLDEGGTAAVLQFPGVTYRGQREQLLRAWITESGHLAEVHAIPGGQFTDTAIPTVCLVFRKGYYGDVRFLDVETGLDSTVTIEQIAANDYSWSPSRYIEPPAPERPAIDPWATEQAARASTCNYLNSRIKFAKVVAGIEHWPVDQFLDDLEAVIASHRKAS